MFKNENIQKLNELELILYNYVINNNEKVIYMRIRELAEINHVSTSTVLRFCKKLGCEGFSEFKVKLKMELEMSKSINITDDVSIFVDFFKKVENSGLEKKIEKAADIIGQSDELGFLGVGMSGSLCKYASWYFSAIGKSSIVISEPFFKINCNKNKNNVFVVLSISGETPTTIDHLNRIKKYNCKIISITNSENSTIAKLSDLNLAYYIQREHVGYSDITTQVPVVYIIESIAKKLHNKYLLNSD